MKRYNMDKDLKKLEQTLSFINDIPDHVWSENFPDHSKNNVFQLFVFATKMQYSDSHKNLTDQQLSDKIQSMAEVSKRLTKLEELEKRYKIK